MTRRRSHPFRLATLPAAILLLIMPYAAAVEFANIDIVDGGGPTGDPPTVSIGAGQGTAGFFAETGAVTGEFPIRIGATASDDAAGGVLLGYVREIGRSRLDAVGGTETLYASSATARDVSGSLSLVAHCAGIDTLNPNTLYASGDSFNANLAAAYFPFSEGWVAGTAYNSTAGGDFDELVASAGLQLGTNFQQSVFGTGDNLVTLPGVADARRQGLLLVNAASNESTYALSEPTAGGDGFNVTGHLNSTNGSAGTVAPVSFVFLPLGTPNVTMARMNARGHGQNPQPVPMISSGGAFTVTREDPGQYRLSIDGETPSSGVLLLSPSGSNDGNDGASVDNILTYRPDGDGWVILSQDLDTLDGNGQESGVRAESYFSFAFLPFDAPPTGPGPIPAVETLTSFNTQRIIGWNAEVTSITNGNDIGSMYVEVPDATSDVNILPLFENRGDNVFAVDGAFLSADDGIAFSTVSEGLRDNSTVGGFLEYGVTGADTTFDNEWWIRTAVADPVADPGEHNVNFSVAFFGADAGFDMAQAVDTDATTATADVSISGVNSLTDGVLIVNPSGNDDNFVTAAPRGDGSGWDVSLFDNGTAPEGGEANQINYVFLPFDSENLIAGRVSNDGSIQASTDQNDFSLTRDTVGEYLLTVDGKTPDDGMLLLTSSGSGDGVDNALVYEASGSDFRIIGLDMITSDEAGLGSLVSPEDTAFTFAYIDFDMPPIAPIVGLTGDYSGNGIVDAIDYVIWRDNLGTSTVLPNDPTPGSVTADDFDVWAANFGANSGNGARTSAVPEPATMALIGGLLAGCLFSRRRPR